MNTRSYLIRRKFFKLFGAAFHVYDENGYLLGYSKQKAFKLKEDIRLYTDETMSRELLVIKARNVIDFSAAYDVMSPSGHVLGTWQRRGLTSLLRDSWTLSIDNAPVAELTETSMARALIRRFLCNLVPQTYVLSAGMKIMATYAQCFNPFILKLKVDVARKNTLDPNLILAGGILLNAIEGRQN